MSNRVKFAAAIAAAGMLAVAGAPAAEAVTINPSLTSYDFGSILIGTTASIGVSFDNPDNNFINGTTIDPDVSPNPPFSSSLGFGACNSASCFVTILFKPTTAGEFTGNALVEILFAQDQSQSFTIPLKGVGVVPVPGALPLFLTGLGGLAYMSRRRKATV
jgi:hypothetical protein